MTPIIQESWSHRLEAGRAKPTLLTRSTFSAAECLPKCLHSPCPRRKATCSLCRDPLSKAGHADGCRTPRRNAGSSQRGYEPVGFSATWGSLANASRRPRNGLSALPQLQSGKGSIANRVQSGVTREQYASSGTHPGSVPHDFVTSLGDHSGKRRGEVSHNCG